MAKNNECPKSGRNIKRGANIRFLNLENADLLLIPYDTWIMGLSCVKITDMTCAIIRDRYETTQRDVLMQTGLESSDLECAFMYGMTMSAHHSENPITPRISRLPLGFEIPMVTEEGLDREINVYFFDPYGAYNLLAHCNISRWDWSEENKTILYEKDLFDLGDQVCDVCKIHTVVALVAVGDPRPILNGWAYDPVQWYECALYFADREIDPEKLN